MATKQQIDEQLRQAIERSGKTRYRISLESGISQAVLSRFASGENTLSLVNVEKLCASIGVRLVLEPDPHSTKPRTRKAKPGR